MAKNKDAALLKTGRERYDAGVTYDKENRDAMRTDLEVVAGNAWDEATKEERKAQGRLMISENRIPSILAQVNGNVRENKPAIKVRGVDDSADPDVAELYTGLIRDIENGSSSKQPIIRSSETAVQCGIGHFRILTDYRDADSFDQDILMEPIHNPFAVVWDPDSVMVTREDANWCFVTSEMSLDAFKSAYPKASTDAFDADKGEGSQHYEHWGSKDKVTVAEYWVKEPYDRMLGLTHDGQIHEVEKGYDETLYQEVRVRKSYRVKMYKINGHEVLEPPVEWPTPHIPIIAVIGEEVQRETGVYRRGITRLAISPQQRLNYWLTSQTEWLAQQPKSPFMVTLNQIEGLTTEWNAANDTLAPYIPYNSDPNAPGPPQRAQPPVGASSMYQEVMLATDALKAVTGIHDASLGAKGNETSGVAINARKAQSGTGNYVYIDNLARSVEYAGRILISLIPKIYDTERAVRILGEDGSEKYKVINQKYVENGEEIVKNDLSVGRYDVVVTTGPGYATRRAEAFEMMMQFVQTSPAMAQGVMDLIADSADWPNKDAFIERLKKMTPPGLITPDEDDPEAQQAAAAGQQQAQMQQQQQQMVQQLAMMEMKSKIEKLQAETQSKKADTAETIAQTRETNADAVLKEIQIHVQNGTLNQLVQMAMNRPPPNQVPFNPNPQAQQGLF